MSKKVILGLSGGMDSTSLLGHFINEGFTEIHCCNFQYGSKHNFYELQAFNNVVNYYRHVLMSKLYGDIHTHHYDLNEIFSKLDSNLLKSGGEIPEGHYNDSNMVQTVVPGRNLIFASIMASLAESLGIGTIALGVHSGDHHIYPDCRPNFINSLFHTVFNSSGGKVIAQAPFLNLDKTKIIELGMQMNPKVPYHLTRTCYKDQVLSCGKCGSCVERKEAFDNNYIKDPIEYE